MFSPSELDRLEVICDKVMKLSPYWSWPNWCISLFLHDLDKYPVDDNKLYSYLLSATDDYLLFFSQSRGFDRPFGFYIDLWRVVESNIVLLYLDWEVSYLLTLPVEKHVPEDDGIARFVQILAGEEKGNWTELVRKLNAETN